MFGKHCFFSIIRSYNNTYQSSLKQTPNSVSKDDEDMSWHSLYLDHYLMGQVKPPYYQNYVYKENE